MACLHSSGRLRKSRNDRNRIESGKPMAAAVLRKKIGGSKSGPAAELDFNLEIILVTFLIEIGTSLIPIVSDGRRDLKGGVVWSSVV